MTDELEFPYPQAPAFGATLELMPGVLWLRMPLPLTLDHINLYLVDAGEGWYIIDTGLKTQQIRRHWEHLFERDLRGKPVLGIFVTHLHPDHLGQAGWLSEYWRAPLYMTRAEYYTGRTFCAGPGESASWMVRDFYLRAGLSASDFEQVRAGAHGFSSIVEPMPGAFIHIEDGERLDWGGRVMQVVTGQGHSPDHACLLDAENGLFFSGDQVIATISSNVSVMGIEPEANPLELWMASHQKLLALPADVLVLPAHGLPFKGLHRRLRQLIEHHEQHLAALQKSCSVPSVAVDLLPVLFKRSLDREQRNLALGECIAHLNCLLGRGVLQRNLRDDGVYLYSQSDACPR